MVEPSNVRGEKSPSDLFGVLQLNKLQKCQTDFLKVRLAYLVARTASHKSAREWKSV